LAKESAEMRLSLIPGLIENLRTNLAQKAESFSAYHLGKVFRLGRDGTTEERQCLGGILYGPRASRGLRTGAAVPLGFLICSGLATPSPGPGKRARSYIPAGPRLWYTATKNLACSGRSIPMFPTRLGCRFSCFSNLTSRGCFSMLRDE